MTWPPYATPSHSCLISSAFSQVLHTTTTVPLPPTLHSTISFCSSSGMNSLITFLGSVHSAAEPRLAMNMVLAAGESFSRSILGVSEAFGLSFTVWPSERASWGEGVHSLNTFELKVRPLELSVSYLKRNPLKPNCRLITQFLYTVSVLLCLAESLPSLCRRFPGWCSLSSCGQT